YRVPERFFRTPQSLTSHAPPRRVNCEVTRNLPARSIAPRARVSPTRSPAREENEHCRGSSPTTMNEQRCKSSISGSCRCSPGNQLLIQFHVLVHHASRIKTFPRALISTLSILLPQCLIVVKPSQ